MRGPEARRAPVSYVSSLAPTFASAGRVLSKLQAFANRGTLVRFIFRPSAFSERSAALHHGCRWRATLLSLALMLLAGGVASCEAPTDGTGGDAPKTGKVIQAITDTDSDGMDDGWETSNFGSLSQTAAGDYDSDGMTNLEEYTNGFNPTTSSDALDDTDGDRYPNVFEVRYSSDPNSSSSTPTATYTVDGGGTGTHTNISAAISAANSNSGTYLIVGIKPGTYSGASNYTASFSSLKKILLIGLQGASKTIIDESGNTSYGFSISTAAVISSLTVKNGVNAFYIQAGTNDVRLVDLVITNSAGNSSYNPVHVVTGNVINLKILGSTFINNGSVASAGCHIWLGSGTLTLTNSVLWNSMTGSTPIARNSGTTLAINYSLVSGMTVTGTGNLASTVDPKVRADGHIPYDSPLRGAGGTIAQSHIDIDGDLRPATSPDMGVDQFVDTDSDNLADFWEMATAGNLTTLTSTTQDEDSDGLTNAQEYADMTNPVGADTDGDGASDGAEVTAGSNPLSRIRTATECRMAGSSRTASQRRPPTPMTTRTAIGTRTSSSMRAPRTRRIAALFLRRTTRWRRAAERTPI